MAANRPELNLLHLPDCMIEQVLEYLSYDEIAKQRMVCGKFNEICQGMLNMGFNRMSKRHAQYLKTIKTQLPRRESERRNHPLARHADILTCIETRMSMLSMTYSKYIEVDLCCFIPGKVIDEVLNVLSLISCIDVPTSSTPRPGERPLRTHEVLQELRDISSMAIDHFDEKIAPALKKAYCEIPSRSIICSPSIQYHLADNSMGSTFLSSPDILKQLGTPESSSGRIIDSVYDPMYQNYARMERKYKMAMRKLNSVIVSHNRQAQKLRNCSMQCNELNAQVVDLRRRLEECTNAKPNIVAAASEEGPTTRSRNIQPRTATIILKRIAETSVKDLPAKRTKTADK